MKTSLYWIDGPWQGGLAIGPRPRGGDWLEDEMQSWKAAGVAVMVSALTDEEIVEMDLQHEAALTQANGLGYLAFPITDRGVPESFRVTGDLVRRLESDLVAGKRVVIHRRQGVGRSALLAACLLVSAGEDYAAAFDRIATARGCAVPDTAEQREWVAKFSRGIVAAPPT